MSANGKLQFLGGIPRNLQRTLFVVDVSENKAERPDSHLSERRIPTGQSQETRAPMAEPTSRMTVDAPPIAAPAVRLEGSVT